MQPRDHPICLTYLIECVVVKLFAPALVGKTRGWGSRHKNASRLNFGVFKLVIGRAVHSGDDGRP